jgi:hypothetical protein
MKVKLFYIYPKTKPEIYAPLAEQFGESIAKFSAGHPFDHKILDGLTPGKDIGAYIEAAKTCDADIMVCLGSHVRINQDGWLKRIVEVWEQCGPGLYGPFASNVPIPHIRTTAFWCPPGWLGNYPWEVVTDQDRYNFELHKERSITNWADHPVISQVAQVTKTRTIGISAFDTAVMASDSLMLDKYTDMIDAAQ